MTCTEIGPDLVALALGQLTAQETSEVEAHLAQCAPCRAELAATRQLIGAAREVPALAPSAGAEERLLAAFRSERSTAVGALPQPARRRTPRILTMIIPLAAAAAVLVALIVSAREHPAEVIEGVGQLDPGEGLTPPDPATAIRGEFDFREGAEIGAGAAPFTVRLTLSPGERASRPGQPQPGHVEIKLLPAARVRRTRPSEIDLAGGTVEIAAGPLAAPFTVTAGGGGVHATIKGTRFLATTADGRLVVVVREGTVELGRSDGKSEVLSAGEQGLVDSERLLSRPADARANGDTLLTPKATLTRGAAPLAFEAALSVGEGGPVSIQAFDDATPRFLVRVHGGATPDREFKLQRSMLTGGPPAPGPEGTSRLSPGAPYRLAFSLAGIGLPPGRCDATIRYMSYRRRGSGAEWLGVVESDPVEFEVPAK